MKKIGKGRLTTLVDCGILGLQQRAKKPRRGQRTRRDLTEKRREVKGAKETVWKGLGPADRSAADHPGAAQ